MCETLLLVRSSIGWSDSRNRQKLPRKAELDEGFVQSQRRMSIRLSKKGVILGNPPSTLKVSNTPVRRIPGSHEKTGS